MSPFEATRAAMALERIDAAVRGREAAETEWREALTDALHSRCGFTAADIARRAGITRQRVYQVANGA